MIRPSLALVSLLSALAVAPAVRAEDAPGPVPAPAANASVRVSLSKNGNVRYAPTTQAKVIVTLPAKSEVELLGPAKVNGWYIIRFPAEGSAWVHGKVLQPIDGGKRWKVIEDKARARDDATLRSEVVSELALGEVLIDKGRTIGDWHSVGLPNAVAYISQSVLDLPTNIDQARTVSAARAGEAAATWAAVQQTYASYYGALQQNPQNALTLDWDGLSRQLDGVIANHGEAAVRVSAQRLKDGIANVAAAALALQKAKGITPVARPADLAAADPAPVKLPAASVGDPLRPPMLTIPADAPQMPATELARTAPAPAPVAEVKPVAPAPVVPAKPFAAEGFVSQKSIDALGVNEVIVDGDSNVVALLKVKVGKDIQLSEYYWRWVGVRGEVQEVDPAKHGLGRKVPLIIIDEIALSR